VPSAINHREINYLINHLTRFFRWLK
jgi:hypothetical protein